MLKVEAQYKTRKSAEQYLLYKTKETHFEYESVNCDTLQVNDKQTTPITTPTVLRDSELACSPLLSNHR